jgi:hypothetical protein
MTYIYFDESGDLGFDFSKQGTSGTFLITFLITNNKRPILTLVKKVFMSLPLATKYKNSGILHARYEKPATVKKLLSILAIKDVKVATMRLDKRKVFIAGNPNDLYANIVTSLINRLYADGVFENSENVILIASQRNTSQSLNERFTESVVNSTLGTSFTVKIVKPADDKCLQAVDFVSWAFWQKYVKEDYSYTDLIADIVIHEYEMYK